MAEGSRTGRAGSKGESRVGDYNAAVAQLRTQVVIAVAFGLFVTLLLTVTPLYVFQIIDRVLTSRSVPTLVMLGLLAGGAMVVLWLLDWIRHLILIRAGTALDRRLGTPVVEVLFDTAARAPRPGMDKVLDDLTTWRRFLGGWAMVRLCDLPWVPVLLLLILVVHAGLGLLAIGIALVLGLLAWLPKVMTRRRGPLSQTQAIRTGTHLAERLGHAPTLVAMGMTPAVFQAWRQQRDAVINHETSLAHTLASLAGLTGLMHALGVVLMLGVGAWLVVRNDVTDAALIAVVLLSDRAFGAVSAIGRHWFDLIAVDGARRRLRTVFEQAAPARERMPLPAPRGAVALQQASVAPPGHRLPVLKGLSLALDPGGSLGVIGPSGAGKTVLARTLVGLWAPLQGTVRLDGNDLRNWNPDQLGEHIGYLSQEVDLVDGTVAENIARLGPVDADAVIAAARRAGVHQTILRLPEGYDTPVGADGRALPAGLRQRIGLARALFRDPALVVLDEPNAFQDSEGEQALLNAVTETREAGRAVVLVTQKPALLSVVETVLVLRDGQVEMMGPRKDVMNRFARAASTPLPPSGSGPSQGA
ncbi:type I secretion system permease/ATPase [uncultured Rhodospira sp.]|uniref:type I secretion system permease/ATPase n=1 Tax=uncultured Rhodospira sp. TaxID=1936189 RepID=UPI00262326BF|nr:type I secretion system permease/ATPase [uncultured Rhodospira sp.]